MIRSRRQKGASRVTAPAVALIALLSACASGSGMLIQDGLALEQAGRYEEAVAYYRSLQSSGEVAPAQVGPRLQAALEAWAASKADQGQRALTTGQVDQAVALAGDAYRLAPNQPRVKALLKAVGDVQMERSSSLMASGKTREAIEVLERLLAAFPEHRQARETRDDIVESYSSRLETAIRSYEQQGLQANAFLGWLALSALQPGDAGVTSELERRRADLIRRYQVPVTWEVSSRGALSQAATSALTDLRLESPFFALQAGGRTPDSLHLTISRLDEDFSQNVEAATGVKSIVVGKRRISNPDRAKLQEELTRVEGQVRGLEDRIDLLHSQSAKLKPNERAKLEAEITRLEREHHQLSTSYVEVSDKLAQMDAEVDADDFRDVRYPLERHRRAAVVAFKLQANSVRPDLPLRVDFDLTARAEVSDEVHPSYPEYGIPARSLQFPKSDVTLRREALLDMARVVGATADTLMNDVLVLELRKGRELLRSGQLDAAAESFVRVLLGTKTEPAPEIAELLRQKGVPSAALVRGEPTRVVDAKR